MRERKKLGAKIIQNRERERSVYRRDRVGQAKRGIGGWGGRPLEEKHRQKNDKKYSLFGRGKEEIHWVPA